MRGKDYIMTKPNYNNMRGWTKLGGQMNSRGINKNGGVRRQGWDDQSNEYGLRKRHWEWRRMQFFKNASYMKSMATSACHTLSQTFQSEIRVRCANRMRLIPVPHLPDSSNRNWCVYDKKTRQCQSGYLPTYIGGLTRLDKTIKFVRHFGSQYGTRDRSVVC